MNRHYAQDCLNISMNLKVYDYNLIFLPPFALFPPQQILLFIDRAAKRFLGKESLNIYEVTFL